MPESQNIYIYICRAILLPDDMTETWPKQFARLGITPSKENMLFSSLFPYDFTMFTFVGFRPPKTRNRRWPCSQCSQKPGSFPLRIITFSTINNSYP